MKDAFTRARTLATDEKWVAELEKAMSEGNLVRVKELVDEGIIINEGKVITRILDSSSDLKIIHRVKSLRQKLTSDYKQSGNFGWAEADISGLSKTEYYAHSGIDELSGTLSQRVPDISLKPQTEIFPWSKVPNSAGYPIARNIDTEYKILTEISLNLSGNPNATGKIILFTERPPCSSCTNVIEIFSKKHPDIELEIIHNNGITLTN